MADNWTPPEPPTTPSIYIDESTGMISIDGTLIPLPMPVVETFPPDPPDDLPRVLAHEDGEYRWILIDRLGDAHARPPEAASDVELFCKCDCGCARPAMGAELVQLCVQCVLNDHVTPREVRATDD